jgi:hypothetical protein
MAQKTPESVENPVWWSEAVFGGKRLTVGSYQPSQMLHSSILSVSANPTSALLLPAMAIEQPGIVRANRICFAPTLSTNSSAICAFVVP